MPIKIEMPIIESVDFYYTGSDKQFNDFLKVVIRDYVVDDKLLPDGDPEEKESA